MNDPVCSPVITVLCATSSSFTTRFSMIRLFRATALEIRKMVSPSLEGLEWRSRLFGQGRQQSMHPLHVGLARTQFGFVFGNIRSKDGL